MVQSVNSVRAADSLLAVRRESPEGNVASDVDLVRRARDGDRDAFGMLVLRYQDAVYGLAWRILRSHEDAEDAAQESFLRAWRGLRTFDSACPFRPWILRIAANFALTTRSRRRTHLELDEEIAAEDRSDSGLPSPVTTASRREILDAVDRMVEALPPENAALFHLRYDEDLSLKEISRILDRRPGALAVTLHRIRERFRQALVGGANEKGVEP